MILCGMAAGIRAAKWLLESQERDDATRLLIRGGVSKFGGANLRPGATIHSTSL
jgi:hypothetical protein